MLVGSRKAIGHGATADHECRQAVARAVLVKAGERNVASSFEVAQLRGHSAAVCAPF